MSLSVQFTGAPDGDDGPFSLASANGWRLFAAWAESLPPGPYEAVKELADAGTWAGTDALADQLAAALAAQPPAEPGVADTARQLAEKLGVGDPDETATVTDDDAGGEVAAHCGGPGSGVPGPCPTGAAGQRAATLAGRVKELPGRVAVKARSYVAAKYQQLSARYGPGYARGIMAAGLLGVPLPIPGGSLLTAAPVLALAELHLRLSAGHADAPAGVTLSPADIARLGAAFVRELLAGWKADAKGTP